MDFLNTTTIYLCDTESIFSLAELDSWICQQEKEQEAEADDWEENAEAQGSSKKLHHVYAPEEGGRKRCALCLNNRTPGSNSRYQSLGQRL